MPSNVDWLMIEKHELTASFGYMVPGDIGAKSGITVGAGIDLGRTSWDEVKNWKVSAELKEKLRPYVGLKGVAARNTLYQIPEHGEFSSMRPLQWQVIPPKREVVAQHGRAGHVLKAATGGLILSESEVRELNYAVRTEKLDIVRAAYDRCAGKAGRPAFDLLPAPCQTAILSFCFHYGPYIGQLDVTDRRRIYWEAIVQGDWAVVIECLLSRFMEPKEKAFAARRLEEIILFMRGMGLREAGPLLKQKLFNAERLRNMA